MVKDAVIIEFPLGSRRAVVAGDASKSVARIAKSLSRRLRLSGQGPVAAAPLSIRLEDLSGVADATIASLSDLARAGSLTSASAARLALRHADEVRGRSSGVSRPNRSRGGQVEIEATLAGDPFGSFALSLRRGDEWVGLAPMRALDRLFELCPADRGPACLLIGCDAARRPAVRLLAPVDWRQRLSDLASGEASRVEGHVHVIGGLPSQGDRRRVLLYGVEQAVHRSGGVRLSARRRYAMPVRRQHS